MIEKEKKNKIQELKEAISAQEKLRGKMSDSLIDLTVATLQKELDEIETAEQELEQQRKLVTVLFMDVVNSTKMTQDMDPEESMEILDVSLQEMAEPVRKNGGQVIRFMGDGFLAVFGLPNARENDAEMAVHTALEILDESERISESLNRKWEIQSFQVRIGINTGLVVSGGVTEADHTIMGSTINLAARLEKAAEPGAILISKQTYQHIRGIFDLDKRNPVAAKGFPEPVETFNVFGIKPRAFRLMNRGVEGVETRMIGRDMEMRRLQVLSQKTMQDRVFRFVTIVGEAGMGKSRLLDEFESWLDLQSGRFKIYKGRASLELQKQPYALFREIFASTFEILDNDPIEIVREKFSNGFRRSLQVDNHVELKAQLVGHLLGYDIAEDESVKRIFENPQLAHDRAFKDVEMYFRSIAERFTVLIFLDDIHWADESSLDLLDYLREALVDSPVMIMALSRPSLLERRDGWGTGMGCETIELRSLSNEQSEQLVVEVLQKAENIPEAFCKTIAEHAEGNPFYVEELIRMLVDDGVITIGDSAWQIQQDQLPDLEIPPTLTGIVQARFEGLQKDDYITLQQSSVVGKVFWDDTLVHINKGHPLFQGNIINHLKSLQDRDMIFQRGSSAFSGAIEYSYGHGILRDVAYESVLLKQRKSYHSLTADWLIGQHSSGAVEMWGVIAGHLVEAERLDEAVDFYLQAADSAAKKFANEEAVELYQQALELISEDAVERRYSILLSLESLWFVIGNRDEQSKVLEKLADAANDPHDKANVALRRAWFLFYTSNFSEMFQAAQEAIDHAGKIDKPNILQEGFYALAWAQMQSGELDLAKINAQRSLELAQKTGYRAGEGNVHNILGLIDLTQGRYADARVHIEEFLKIAQEIGNQERQLIALNSMVVILVTLGEYERARGYGTQQLELAVELGNRTTEGSAYVNLAWVASAQEDWQFADEYVEKGIASKEETRHREALAEGLVWQGYVKLGLGQPHEAEEAFRKSLDLRREMELESLQIESMAGLGQALLKQGDLDGAREYGEKVHEYISRDEDLSGTWEPLKIYWTCYQILQAVGDSRKDDFLKEAVENLQKRAEKITDKAAQKRYLNNVPWHKEILAEWERIRNL